MFSLTRASFSSIHKYTLKCWHETQSTEVYVNYISKQIPLFYWLWSGGWVKKNGQPRQQKFHLKQFMGSFEVMQGHWMKTGSLRFPCINHGLIYTSLSQFIILHLHLVRQILFPMQPTNEKQSEQKSQTKTSKAKCHEMKCLCLTVHIKFIWKVV